MEKLFVIVVALLAAFQAPVVLSDQVAPCVYNCLNYTSQPCYKTSHSALNTCIDTACLTPASQMGINFAPKAQYSCQQSLIPGSSNASPVLQLSGNGDCVDSPFEFRSFFVSAGSSTHMDIVAERCHIVLYEQTECNGGDTVVDIGGLTSGKCTFNNGKSVRLDCGIRVDRVALHRTLDSICSNATAPQPNATAPYPTTGPNITASVTGSVTALTSSTASKTPTAPFADTAKNDRDAKPSVAAFVAVIAAALAML